MNKEIYKLRFRLLACVVRGALLAAVLLLAFDASADEESDLGLAGGVSGMLAGDLQALLQSCIDSNKTNPPAGNPGPFTRGYKEIIVLMAQCFSGGFSNLASLGDNVIVGAAADPRKESSAGFKEIPGSSPKEVMVWFEVLNDVIRQNTNVPLKLILDFVRSHNPDTNAMTPPPVFSPGGDGIVVGDPMSVLQPGTSFHAVLFGGYNDIAGKQVGEATRQHWLLSLGTAHALNDMRATLQYFLHIPDTNIAVKSSGSLADLRSMITNAWAKMNDNEQFILFVADHGSRDLLVPPPFLRRYGNGYSANFMTDAYLVSPNVEQPRLRLQTSYVGQPGEVRLNAHRIGTLPVSTGPEYYEFCFSPKLIKAIGNINLAEVVVPKSSVGIESWGLSTGPAAAGDFDLGMDPVAAVINVLNTTGTSKTDFHAVYEGRLGTNIIARAQRTQAEGTPIANWAVGGPTISYDWANDVTTVSWEDLGNPITNGAYASFTVITSNRMVRSLKYAWSPASANPEDDLAPVNLKSASSVTSSNFQLNIVAAPLLAFTQHLELSARYSGNLIPSDQLAFNSTAITSLPNSATQTVILPPETTAAVTFPLAGGSPLDPLPTALVESVEHWQESSRPNELSRITEVPLLRTSDTTCVTSCPNSGVFFTVNVAGGTFQWYRNGVLLPGETGDTLTLLNLDRSHAGIYTGIGTNLFEIKRKFFQLIIRDFVLPLVTGPADITVKATSASGAIVNYSGIGASDACGMLDGSTFLSDPPPGLFPIGTTEVTCSIADTFHNVGKHRFYVTVLPLGTDLGISLDSTYAVLRWADSNAVLQGAPQVTGPWTDLATASPHVRSLDTQEFFRLHFQ